MTAEFKTTLLGRLIDKYVFDHTGAPVDLTKILKDFERNREKLISEEPLSTIEREKLQIAIRGAQEKFIDYLETKYPD